MPSRSAPYPIGSDMIARDLRLTVPLDWEDPAGDTIDLFAREVVAAERQHEDLPILVHLQGGPGGKGLRPLTRSHWVAAALSRFRLIIPDQRGTGRSTPFTGSTAADLPPEEVARRLSLHRADAIIRDMEAIRRAHADGRRWWTLGQSYGGFLTLHYLSTFPEAIAGSVITGGLPGLSAGPDEVYARTFPRVLEKNTRFRSHAPHLTERASRIADLLRASEVRLPDGDRLTVRRFQTLGFDFGMGPGFDRVHWILDEAFADAAETVLSETFLATVAHQTGFATNPLYMALQESIYGPGPARWSAQRTRDRYPEFDEGAAVTAFTGEMMFPWMFAEIRALRGFQEGMEILANREWPILMYDASRLAANEVPIEAVVYLDDMYVDADFSMETVRTVGDINAWVTNEYEHDGVAQTGVAERLLDRLAQRTGGFSREGV